MEVTTPLHGQRPSCLSAWRLAVDSLCQLIDELKVNQDRMCDSCPYRRLAEIETAVERPLEP